MLYGSGPQVDLAGLSTVSFLKSCPSLIFKDFCSPRRILGDPGGDSGKSTQMLLSSCERTQTFAVHDERHAEKAGTFTQSTALTPW